MQMPHTYAMIPLTYENISIIEMLSCGAIHNQEEIMNLNEKL